MGKVLTLCIICVLLASAANAVTLSDKMHGRIAEGNRRYDAGDHEEALNQYRQAQELDSTHIVPHFNAGGALYRLGRFPEGTQEFLRSASSPTDSIVAMSYYNLGNSMFKAGDFKSAAEAYKRSLLIDPEDGDAKFNLELAMKMMQQQQQQQEQQEQQDQQDQQQNEQQQQQQQEQQEEQQQEQEQRQQQAPSQITPEDLERILAAIEASDKNTQEEMLKKASKRRTVTGKDW